ncbi:MAG: hypothetical protein JSW00_07235 [Thermoplasmata archaeon]|nr:MAG: hypothetical protein JSW00_07235 [Thermoplasmata archaeon]
MVKTIKCALNQFADSRIAVWDFMEQQQNLLKIVQDKKVNELIVYLGILNVWEWIGKNHTPDSNFSETKSSSGFSQYSMKQFLRHELESKAKNIAEELDSLSQKFYKGGNYLEVIERTVNKGIERRFSSKKRVYFFH